MIYLEAGFDAGEMRLSHYRTLEDLLSGYGYRIFRIYEQRNEWRLDSPLLRRANFAFMSEAFAARNPYRLSRDLFAARKEIETLRAEAAAQRAAAAEAREALGTQARALAEAHAAADHASERERDAAAAARAARAAAAEARAAQAAAQTALAAAEDDRRQDAETMARERDARVELAGEVMRLRERLDHVVAYGRRLEKRHGDMLGSRSWRALEPLRGAARRLRGRPTPAPFEPALGEAAGALASDWRPPPASRPGAAPKTSGKTTKGAAAKRGPAPVDPYRLDDKLWGGFSTRALPDLEALTADPAIAKSDRSEANWVLARWRAAHQDYAGAYERVALMRALDPSKGGTTRCLLLESDCLTRLDRAAESRELLLRAIPKKPDADDLCLAMANALLPGGADAAPASDEAADEARLDWVNRIYARRGLRPLAKRDPGAPLSIRNLAAPGAGRIEAEGRPKVTVIMPVYEAAETLPFALRGLLAQTWANLEILVVDDCSPDDTVAVAEAFAARDPRVRGPAPDRRTKAATPRATPASPSLPATSSPPTTPTTGPIPRRSRCRSPNCRRRSGCRATTPTGSAPARRSTSGAVPALAQSDSSKNVSSIMLRRRVMDALGGWVEVRVGADTDLMRRARGAARPEIARGNAFSGPSRSSAARRSARSPGSRPPMCAPSITASARSMTTRASTGARAPGARSCGSPPRAIPAPSRRPRLILPKRAPDTELDLLFVTDFAMKGGAFESRPSTTSRRRWRRAFSAGVLHWRRYDLDVTKPLNAPLRALAQAGRLRIVAPGEKLRGQDDDRRLSGDPAHKPDLFPEIDTDDLVVVVNQMAEPATRRGRPAVRPAGAARAAASSSSAPRGSGRRSPGWCPSSMRADPRYPAPSATIWTPLIDTGDLVRRAAAWRGRRAAEPGDRPPRARPLHQMALTRRTRCARPIAPTSPARSRSWAAPTARSTSWAPRPRTGRVHALRRDGDARASSPGSTSSCITRTRTTSRSSAAPCSRRSPLGQPAVLPPVFRQTFGEAALYAEPEEVWDADRRRSGPTRPPISPKARRGRDFVLAQSDWSRFPARPSRHARPRRPQRRTPPASVAAQAAISARTQPASETRGRDRRAQTAPCSRTRTSPA